MRIKGLESLTLTGYEKTKKSMNKLYENFENREQYHKENLSKSKYY